MTTLPAPVHAGVELALEGLGLPREIRAVTPVSGGCINHGARIQGGSGEAFFVKWNAEAQPRFFEAEARGLLALAATHTLRVPHPLATGGGSGSPGWLLMEYVPPGSAPPGYAQVLGRGLAALHGSTPTGARFGGDEDNWIGGLTQCNTPDSSWARFWRDRRLAPQMELAWRGGLLGGAAASRLERTLALTETALAEVDPGPVHLIHGDLWGGNVYCGPHGEPVLIDPAVYHGHGEVDLAMSQLFGGFDRGFYQGYDEVLPVSPAYHAYRRDLYQLYYLLVHVNLFGAQYEARTVDSAARVVAALQG